MPIKANSILRVKLYANTKAVRVFENLNFNERWASFPTRMLISRIKRWIIISHEAGTGGWDIWE